MTVPPREELGTFRAGSGSEPEPSKGTGEDSSAFMAASERVFDARKPSAEDAQRRIGLYHAWSMHGLGSPVASEGSRDGAAVQPGCRFMCRLRTGTDRVGRNAGSH